MSVAGVSRTHRRGSCNQCQVIIWCWRSLLQLGRFVPKRASTISSYSVCYGDGAERIAGPTKCTAKGDVDLTGGTRSVPNVSTERFVKFTSNWIGTNSRILASLRSNFGGKYWDITISYRFGDVDERSRHIDQILADSSNFNTLETSRRAYITQ